MISDVCSQPCLLASLERGTGRHCLTLVDDFSAKAKHLENRLRGLTEEPTRLVHAVPLSTVRCSMQWHPVALCFRKHLPAAHLSPLLAGHVLGIQQCSKCQPSPCAQVAMHPRHQTCPKRPLTASLALLWWILALVIACSAAISISRNLPHFYLPGKL